MRDDKALQKGLPTEKKEKIMQQINSRSK